MHAALAVLPGLFLIGMVGGAAPQDSQRTREPEQRAQLQARADFLDSLRKLDLLTEDGCKTALARIADPASKQLWNGTDIANDVQSIEVRARNNLESIKNKTLLQMYVSKVNAKMQNSDALSTDELADLQDLIHWLDPQIVILESRVQDELKQHRKVVAKALALKLREEAKGFAAANGDKPKQALKKYARAEDEVRKLLDRTYTESKEAAARAMKDDSLAPAAAEAKHAFDSFEQHYREILAESDVLSAAAFHPVAIEQVPWTDLLTADAKWSAAVLQGFEYRIENGTLFIKGPDAATGKQGVMSVGDQERWRDFVLDFEFTFESGAMTMYFRMGKTIINTESMTIESHVAGSAPPLQGKSYQGEASLIGSSFRFHLKAEGCEPDEMESKWVNSRKGAFGLVIPDGTQVKFTRLRVRVLR